MNQADLETNIDNDSARPLAPPYYPYNNALGSAPAPSHEAGGPPQRQKQQQLQQEQQPAAAATSQVVGRSRSLSLSSAGPAAVGTLNPSCDYTPANYISLLFTDMGVLTPAAVSDELIKLYQ